MMFGWAPSETDPMSLDDLAYWWAKAKARAPGKRKDG